MVPANGDRRHRAHHLIVRIRLVLVHADILNALASRVPYTHVSICKPSTIFAAQEHKQGVGFPYLEHL